MPHAGQGLSCHTGLSKKTSPRLTGKLPFRLLVTVRQEDLQSHFKIWEDAPGTKERQARSSSTCAHHRLVAHSPGCGVDMLKFRENKDLADGSWQRQDYIPKLTIIKSPLFLLLITFNSGLFVAFCIHVTSMDCVTLNQLATNKIPFLLQDMKLVPEWSNTFPTMRHSRHRK